MNAGIGVAIGDGKTTLGLLAAALPLLAAVVIWTAAEHRSLLVFLAFALALSGVLPGSLPGIAKLYPADVIPALGAGSWILVRLLDSTAERPSWPRAVPLSWPFVFFALAILISVVRGHVLWGYSYLSQPVRLIVYALIAGAVAGMSARSTYRGLVVVFYAGTILQTILAVYHVATGTSQAALDVSTGGTRVLALSTAMFMAGTLVLALLNLERQRQGRVGALHLGMAILATVDIVLSLGRTTFVAVAVLGPLLLIGLRHARRSLLALVPLALPVVTLLAVVVVQLEPSLPSSLAQRVTASPSTDPSVIERKREVHAVLQGIGKEPFFGLGFGRPVQWVSIDRSVHESRGNAEDDYATILAGGGALALGSFVVLMLGFFVDAFRRLRGTSDDERALLVFAMSMVFIILLNMLTGPILSTPRLLLPFWICLLLPTLVATNRPLVVQHRPRAESSRTSASVKAW
jgi:O-antigen ligase